MNVFGTMFLSELKPPEIRYRKQYQFREMQKHLKPSYSYDVAKFYGTFGTFMQRNPIRDSQDCPKSLNHYNLSFWVYMRPISFR